MNQEKFVQHFTHHAYSIAPPGEVGQKAIGGRVAVVFFPEHDVLEIHQIGGQAMAIEALPEIIRQLGQTFIDVCNAAHIERRNQYAVELHTGMSGAKTFRLITRRNDQLLDYPTTGAVHVSMYGKLNRGLRLWIGDIPPLMAAMQTHGLFETGHASASNGAMERGLIVTVREVPTREPRWRRDFDLLTIEIDDTIDFETVDKEDVFPDPPEIAFHLLTNCDDSSTP